MRCASGGADLGMVETEDRTDEHGLFAAVKDNMAMAVLNETAPRQSATRRL